MLEKGCKKVLNLIDPQAKTVASSRGGLSFIRKMQEAGAEVITEEFLWDDVIHYPRSIQRTREILAEYPDLDGIMANDLCASSFLKTARELNRKVPQQIIAYDGTYITDFNYRTIASIRQDVALIAREAVQVLVKLINGQPLGNEAVYVPVSYKDGDTI
jgi:LacI family sucrose operon transcriptional repressor